MAANDNKDFASLKGLLFSDETEEIAALKARLAAIDGRVGDDAHLTGTVANVIAASLRQAEVKGHRELAQAISPLVVASIRREIVDSRDAMVEALYPITGRLVSSYVSGAIQKLSQDINARFDALLSPRSLMLRAKAALTGKSYGALLLAENARFHVSQILLVEAQTGICLARWPDQPKNKIAVVHQKVAPANAAPIAASNVDMISALLTAIMDFSREAFANSETELRSLNFGNLLLLLRRSPQYIVAAVGRGQVTPAFEQMVDEEFLNILDVLNKNDKSPEPLLEQLHEKLDSAPALQKKRGKFSPALMFFSLMGLAVVGIVGWNIWRGIEARQLAAKVATLEHLPELQGYPVSVQVQDRVSIAGLVPNEAARNAVQKMAGELFPTQKADIALTVTPSAQSLEELKVSVQALAQQTKSMNANMLALREDQAKTAALIASQETANVQNLNNLRGAVSAKVETQVQDVAHQIESNAKTTAEVLTQKQAAYDSLASSFRELTGEVKSMEAQLRSPVLKLREWIESHAIYFGEAADYRDEAAAKASLTQLATLLKAAPEQKLRVVGYSDEPAVTSRANYKASLARAQHVASSLTELGISPDRLIILARATAQKIAENDGIASANRRVAFELAAEGE